MMFQNIPSYPKYKDTGVEWLGKVPEHWDIRPLKRIARLNPSKSEIPPAQRNVNAVFLPMDKVSSDGRIDTSIVKHVSELWNGFTCFRENDVIVAKIAPCFENGKGACLKNLPTKIGFGSTEFHVLRPSKATLSEFLYLVTILREFRQTGAETMTGAAGQQRVPSSFIEQFSICLPPLPEQTTIVRFLDWADRRIRRVIRLRNQRIKLLEEYKQALINRTVTGKIDVRMGKPYLKYKQSGVEWLGEVPAHWEVSRLKHWVGINKNVLPDLTPPDYEFWYLDIGSVGTGSLLNQPQRLRFGDAPSRARRIVRRGDTIVSPVRTYLKAVYFIEDEAEDVVASTGFAVLTPLQETEPKFVSYLVQSDSFTNRVTAESIGIAYPAIAETRLASFHVAVPPLPEQTAIAEFLDEKTKKIDDAIVATRRTIDLLNEFRTRLIADVVTGKLDVREAAAKLPEDTPDDVAQVSDVDINKCDLDSTDEYITHKQGNAYGH